MQFPQTEQAEYMKSESCTRELHKWTTSSAGDMLGLCSTLVYVNTTFHI
jgi:hypothetical protein